MLFGHFGDRIGRKKTLVIALVMMGIASTLIGLLPTYATIGIAAPILLSLLRFSQGLAIGGQWGGAMLLVTESAPADQRGYYGAYAQAGAPVGVILANLAFILISATVSEEFFMTWGWRIPFLASVVLIGISMYIQLNMEDTQAFKELERHFGTRLAAEGSQETVAKRSPVIEALVKYPKRIALAAGAFLSIQVSFYILIGFILAYGSDPNGAAMSRDDMLIAVLLASALQVPNFGLQPTQIVTADGEFFMLGAVLTGVWGFALFPLVDTGNFWLIVLGITGGLVFLGLMYGPQAAFSQNCFQQCVLGCLSRLSNRCDPGWRFCADYRHHSVD